MHGLTLKGEIEMSKYSIHFAVILFLLSSVSGLASEIYLGDTQDNTSVTEHAKKTVSVKVLRQRKQKVIEHLQLRLKYDAPPKTQGTFASMMNLLGMDKLIAGNALNTELRDQRMLLETRISSLNKPSQEGEYTDYWPEGVTTLLHNSNFDVLIDGADLSALFSLLFASIGIELSRSGLMRLYPDMVYKVIFGDFDLSTILELQKLYPQYVATFQVQERKAKLKELSLYAGEKIPEMEKQIKAIACTLGVANKWEQCVSSTAYHSQLVNKIAEEIRGKGEGFVTSFITSRTKEENNKISYLLWETLINWQQLLFDLNPGKEFVYLLRWAHGL